MPRGRRDQGARRPVLGWIKRVGRHAATLRTGGVAGQTYAPHADGPRIEGEVLTEERFAETDDQLQRLEGLQAADDPARGAEDARLAAPGHGPGSRRAREKTAVAGAPEVRREHRY